MIAWVGTVVLVKCRFLSGSQSTWETDCICLLLCSKSFAHHFCKWELYCTICVLKWWWMIQEWWWFFLCSGSIVLFLSRFLVGESCLFLLDNTKWVICEAQIMMVLKGVWSLVRHPRCLDVLLCLFPSAMGSGALGDWGNRGLSRRCFCPSSGVLSVSLQQFWLHHGACTDNPKRGGWHLFHLEPHPGWCCASPLGNDWAGNENIPWDVVHTPLQTPFFF